MVRIRRAHFSAQEPGRRSVNGRSAVAELAHLVHHVNVTNAFIQMTAVVQPAVAVVAEVRATFEQVNERNGRPTTEVQAFERAGGSKRWNI